MSRFTTNERREMVDQIIDGAGMNDIAQMQAVIDEAAPENPLAMDFWSLEVDQGPLSSALDSLANPETIQWMLDHGADVGEVNVLGEGPVLTLIQAAIGERSSDDGDRGELLLGQVDKVVEMLIVHGAGINDMDDYEATALHQAAEANDTEIALILVKHGANLWLTDDMDRTPQEVSILVGDGSVCRAIDEHLASVKGESILLDVAPAPASTKVEAPDAL